VTSVAKIVLVMLTVAVPRLSGAQIDDFLPAVEPAQVYNAAAFRAFFAGTKPLTAFEVRDRFGMPHKYGPLDRTDAGKKLSPYRAWWYYYLGPVEAVDVRVEDGKVTEVVRHHGRQTEVLRAPPRPPPEKKEKVKR
jgi:hypothetical protein